MIYIEVVDPYIIYHEMSITGWVTELYWGRRILYHLSWVEYLRLSHWVVLRSKILISFIMRWILQVESLSYVEVKGPWIINYELSITGWITELCWGQRSWSYSSWYVHLRLSLWVLMMLYIHIAFIMRWVFRFASLSWDEYYRLSNWAILRSKDLVPFIMSWVFKVESLSYVEVAYP